MSLPTAWVEKIFDKLTINYGTEFVARYKGMPLADVKTDWSEMLGIFMSRPSAIAYFLENLPDRPPTAQQAKNICLAAPHVETALALTNEVKADPDRMRAELAKLAPLQQADQATLNSREYRGAWARKIMVEHKAGIPKTPAQLNMARDGMAALGLTLP